MKNDLLFCILSTILVFLKALHKMVLFVNGVTYP